MVKKAVHNNSNKSNTWQI